MPTKVLISSLLYQPSGQDQHNYVVSLTLAPDTISSINLRSTVQAVGDREINPRYLLIVNAQSNQLVNFATPTYNINVLPFKRETFPLPSKLTSVEITTGTAGPVTVIISEQPLANDQANDLLIQTTAAATLTYQFVNYTVTVNQPLSDLNKTVVFIPPADMAYNLLNPPAAQNGWLEFTYNFGPGTVFFTPPGLTKVNNLWTNANPMPLYAGESGYLQSDGVNWYFAPAATQRRKTTFLTNAAGNWQPDPRMVMFEATGRAGGGAGGGAPATASRGRIGSGGNAGAYGITIGGNPGFAAVPYTTGRPGLGAVGAVGGDGTATTLGAGGAILSIPGGFGGQVDLAPTINGGFVYPLAAAGAVVTTFGYYGSVGTRGMSWLTTADWYAFGGDGGLAEGSAGLGGSVLIASNAAMAGLDAKVFGNGGGGGVCVNSGAVVSAAVAGGNGAQGYLRIDEYW